MVVLLQNLWQNRHFHLTSGLDFAPTLAFLFFLLAQLILVSQSLKPVYYFLVLCNAQRLFKVSWYHQIQEHWHQSALSVILNQSSCQWCSTATSRFLYRQLVWRIRCKIIELSGSKWFAVETKPRRKTKTRRFDAFDLSVSRFLLYMHSRSLCNTS